MFDNIGGNIKALAKVLCWIGIIACIITGIVLMAGDDGLIFVGILIAVVGSLLSWVSSFVLYGFGQLIENSDIIAKQSARSNKKFDKEMQRKEEQQIKENVKTIKREMKDNSISDDTYYDIICPNCKEQLSFTKQEFADNESLTCPLCDAAINTSIYK